VQRGSSHLERVRRLLPHALAKAECSEVLLEVELAAARSKVREWLRWESIPGGHGLLGKLHTRYIQGLRWRAASTLASLANTKTKQAVN